MIYVKRGDRYPVTFTANADLTGASVRLLATLRGTDTAVELTSTFAVSDGSTVITHVLDGTLGVGLYQVEAEASRGGQVMTFPTGTDKQASYEQLQVLADLG